jgi:hypothetical protein
VLEWQGVVDAACWWRALTNRTGITRTPTHDSEAVEAGRRAQRWGVILGTLGRQVRHREDALYTCVGYV